MDLPAGCTFRACAFAFALAVVAETYAAFEGTHIDGTYQHQVEYLEFVSHY